MFNPGIGLVKAKIYLVNENGKPEKDGELTCMFNPNEYTVKKTNIFKETTKQDSNSPHAEYFSAGGQTLSLNLIFDSYENRTDIRLKTDQLWKFMSPKTNKDKKSIHEGKKIDPPEVAFAWGSFWFVSFITSMTQKFTLFLHDGTPVRAEVDIDFVQYTDWEDYRPQNPTSGGGPISRLWQVVQGDRLDAIAAEVYNDANKWRRIAEHNHIQNPLNLHPGQQLQIPDI